MAPLPGGACGRASVATDAGGAHRDWREQSLQSRGGINAWPLPSCCHAPGRVARQAIKLLALARLCGMELAGLEPATSWVR
jgi:hypothetical protein